jgi:DNA-directed RNA polymerase subunit RPC12/RpoP
MNRSHDDPIPMMEYRCPKCKTHYPAEDIPTQQKETNKVVCLTCGVIFGPSYSGESIRTVKP